MDLKQLRYFTEIVDAGSVRQASQSVNISQPALTVAVQNLETELGVSLFARTGRKLIPTNEGRYFYRHARALLSQSERLKVDMRALKTLDKAEIKIAAPVMIASTVLARPIATFMKQYPGIHIQFVQKGGPEVERALLQGEIDIGFLSRPPQSADVTAHKICGSEIKAFVNRQHKLASAHSISWLDLLEHPIVTLPKDYVLHQNIKKKAVFYHMESDIVLESDVLGLILQLILSNPVVGILLEGVSDMAPELVNLSIHDVKDADQRIEASIFACHLSKIPPSHSAESFLSFLESGLDK
ncbi:MAG: LysR family transcriptional regulator [Sphingomonadales bacterium]|jgi:DNA-binding transcriptional LysR family regulator